MHIFTCLLIPLFLLSGCFDSSNKANRSFERAEKESKIENKLIHYQQAVIIDSGYANAYWRMAEIYLKSKSKDYSKALSFMEIVISLAPEWADAIYNRGLIYYCLNNYKLALRDFNQASIKRPFEYKIFFNKAFLYFLQGDYKSSIQDFSKAIELTQSSRFEPLYMRGNANYYSGQYNPAINDYNQSLIIKPELETARQNLAVCYVMLNQYKEALNELQLLKQKDTSYALLLQVLIFKELGEAESLRNALNLLLTKYPSDYKGLLLQTIMQYSLKQYEEVLKGYTRLLSLNPEDLYVLFKRGEIHFLMGHEPEAEIDFKAYQNKLASKSELITDEKLKAFIFSKTAKEIYVLPEDQKNKFPEVNFNWKNWMTIEVGGLGLESFYPLDLKYYPEYRAKMIEQGSSVQKTDIFQSQDMISDLLDDSGAKPVTIVGMSSTTMNILIFLLVLGGVVWVIVFFIKNKPEPVENPEEVFTAAMNAQTFEEKISLLSKTVEIDPFHRKAFYRRAILWNSIGQWPQVIEDCDKLLKLDPDNGEVFRLRGNAKKAMGDIDAAKEDFKKASELKDSIYFVSKGINHIKTSEYELAVLNFNDAVEKNPEQAIAFANRGVARAQLNDLEGAIADYTKAIELAPDYINAYKNRANAYEKTGQQDFAEHDLEKINEIEKEKKEKMEQEAAAKATREAAAKATREAAAKATREAAAKATREAAVKATAQAGAEKTASKDVNAVSKEQEENLSDHEEQTNSQK